MECGYSPLLAAVRKTNPTRPVIVGPGFWNGISALDKLKLPPDKNLILTVHFYDPLQFTHQGTPWMEGSDKWKGTQWSGAEEEQTEVRKSLNNAAEWAKKQDWPCFWVNSARTRRRIWICEYGGRGLWHAKRKNATSVGPTGNSVGFGAYDPKTDKWRPD